MKPRNTYVYEYVVIVIVARLRRVIKGFELIKFFARIFENFENSLSKAAAVWL